MPLAEVMLPEPVDDHPRDQRVGRIGQLPGEFEPAASTRGERRLAKRLQEPAWCFNSQDLVTAPDEDAFVDTRAVPHRRRSPRR